MNGQERFELPS